MQILLERVLPAVASDPLALLDAVVATETEVAMLTVFRSTRADVPVGARRVLPAQVNPRHPSTVLTAAPMRALIDRGRRALSLSSRSAATVVLPDGSAAALAERLRPPPHLFVFGGGPDVSPVVDLAAALGWRVSVWASRLNAASRQRLAAADHLRVGPPGDAGPCVAACARPLAVVMSHRLDGDRQALAMLLASPARYIGVLGPGRRTDRLLGELRRAGAVGPTATADPRLHAPAGLHIGAETPDEIALSIVAQAQAVLAGTTAGHLRDRAGGIHAVDPALLETGRESRGLARGAAP